MSIFSIYRELSAIRQQLWTQAFSGLAGTRRCGNDALCGAPGTAFPTPEDHRHVCCPEHACPAGAGRLDAARYRGLESRSSKLYHVTIEKSARDQLTREKLITWRTGLRRAIFHELTDQGWVRGRDELTLAPPDGVGAAWHLLYGTFRHLNGLMIKKRIPALRRSSPAGSRPTLDRDRIRAGVRRLSGKPGDQVSLAGYATSCRISPEES